MPGQRHRRQTRAVALCCAAAPSVTALNIARAPGRTLMDPTVPQAGYSVQREQTLSLFWTERVNDPVHGLSGCVRTAARDEVAAGVHRTVASGVDPNCLAVDSLKRTVYWSDRSKGAITRASVDCDKAELIAEGCFGHRHLDGPWGLAVDPSTSTLIWSSAGHGKIRRSDLEGQNVQTISDGDTNAWSASGPWGLAPHLRPGCLSARVPSGMRRANDLGPNTGIGRVFWSSWGRVSCCELSDGKVRDVVRGLVDPIGLALDARNNRIFWSDAKAGKVQCANLDGSRVCDVATGLAEPWGIALGPTHIFWTERRRGAIMSCSLRTGQVSEIVSGLNAPEGIGVLNGPVDLPASDGVQIPTPRRAVMAPRRVTAATAAAVRGGVKPGAGTAVTAPVRSGPRTARGSAPLIQDIMRFSEDTLARIQESAAPEFHDSLAVTTHKEPL